MTENATKPVDHLARAKAELVDADDIYKYTTDDRRFSREVATVHALTAIAEELRRLNRPPTAAPAPEDQFSLVAAQNGGPRRASMIHIDDKAETLAVLQDVAAERRRQHAKWGEQNLPDVSTEGIEYRLITAACRFRSIEPSTWASVLLEEVAEAVEETFAGDAAGLRAELVQVAAVAVQWIEAIDRREKGASK